METKYKIEYQHLPDWTAVQFRVPTVDKAKIVLDNIYEEADGIYAEVLITQKDSNKIVIDPAWLRNSFGTEYNPYKTKQQVIISFSRMISSKTLNSTNGRKDVEQLFFYGREDFKNKYVKCVSNIEGGNNASILMAKACLNLHPNAPISVLRGPEARTVNIHCFKSDEKYFTCLARLRSQEEYMNEYYKNARTVALNEFAKIQMDLAIEFAKENHDLIDELS